MLPIVFNFEESILLKGEIIKIILIIDKLQLTRELLKQLTIKIKYFIKIKNSVLNLQSTIDMSLMKKQIIHYFGNYLYQDAFRRNKK